MGEVRASKHIYDEFVVMNCPYCNRLNTFFRKADIFKVRDPKNESVVLTKRRCDTCGVGFAISAYDKETKEVKRFYKVITDKDIKSTKYVLSPHHSFGDPEGYFDPDRIESIIKQTS